MTNETRAEQFVLKYGFDFQAINKSEIVALLQDEIHVLKTEPTDGHTYLRILCGYLFCMADQTDIPLLENAKYGISLDAGCMVEGEWIESLKNGGEADPSSYLRSRSELIRDFVAETKQYFGMDEASHDDGSIPKKGKRHGKHSSPILRGRQPHRRR